MAKETKDEDPVSSEEKYLDDDFKQWLQSLMAEFHIPGMSVAVVHDDKIEAAGYGMARFPDVPATAETVYGTGSTTKAFTSAVMGLLIEDSEREHEGKTDSEENKILSWSTPVKSILKDLETPDPYLTDNVTIEDMLSHRTGIPGHDLIWGTYLKTPSDLLGLLKHFKPNKSIRTACQYNNIVFGIIGYVIETITGEDYSFAVKHRILEPLGMHNTYMGPEEASAALAANPNGGLEFAKGYSWITESSEDTAPSETGDKEKGYYVADAHTSVWPVNPAGAVMSTVLDYAKWISALLKSSVKPPKSDDTAKDPPKDTKDEPLISNKLWKELTTPRTTWLIDTTEANSHVNPRGYALAWLNNPSTYPGEVVVEHGGGLPSFGAQLHLLPNKNFGIIAVGNTAGTSNRVGELIHKELAGRRLGISKGERRRRTDKSKESKKDSETHYNASRSNFARDSLNITNQPTKSSGASAASSTPSTFYLSNKPISLPKTITNPAYSNYTIELAPPALSLSHPNPSNHNITLTRSFLKLPSASSDSSSSSSNNDPNPHTILIRPIQPRGIVYEIVLHPSAVLDNKIIYDLEQIERRGLPRTDLGDQPDPFASLGPGHGIEGDEKYPYRDVQVWTTGIFSVKTNGAVLVLSGNGDEGGRKVEKIGLKLARVEDVEGIKSGVLERGWEDRMEWFVPEEV